MTDHATPIRRAYLASAGNSTELIRVVLGAADDIGMEAALAILEKCVIDKRASWAKQALRHFPRTSDPLRDAFRFFYLDYLHLSLPSDGEIVESSPSRLVTRWWNPCPTLNACLQYGLETRTVCRLAYHVPVQVFLAALDPRLRFDRNYASIRPDSAYCEETITLVQPPDQAG